METGSPKTPGQKILAPKPRESFALRKAKSRRDATVRVARIIVTPLTTAQKVVDPLSHESTAGKRSALAAGWFVTAIALHAVAVFGGIWLGGQKEEFKREEQTVTIEVREPPPPPAEPEPEPEPEPPKIEKAPPKVAPAPPPPKVQAPPPPTDVPPPRVVGLSLDSTVEGSGGPSFAVGNTREGQTAKKAADPTKVAPLGAGPIVEEPKEAPNRTASRIPTVGLVFTAAKKKVEKKPAYPETLKSQGVEADVVVMLSLDESGKVTGVKIVKGALQPEFNESAKKSALEEEFEPAQKNGVPVPTTITFTYRFRLEEP